MSHKDSSNTLITIIIATLGTVGVICAATIGLGLPFAQKVADIYFSATSTPTPTSTPVPTRTPFPTTSPLVFIASIDSSVQDFRFFESGEGDLALDQRFYTTSFDSKTARYINWELNLDYPQPGQRIDFIIHTVWYKSDGSIDFKQDTNTHVESDWAGSYHCNGIGWDQEGNWEKDIYTVVLYINSIEIARASFQVK